MSVWPDTARRRTGPPGFEPGTPGPKPGVLPLHHGPMPRWSAVSCSMSCGNPAAHRPTHNGAHGQRCPSASPQKGRVPVRHAHLAKGPVWHGADPIMPLPGRRSRQRSPKLDRCPILPLYLPLPAPRPDPVARIQAPSRAAPSRSNPSRQEGYGPSAVSQVRLLNHRICLEPQEPECPRQDSNLRPDDYESSALTAEL